jgi:hypothetical protein
MNRLELSCFTNFLYEFVKPEYSMCSPIGSVCCAATVLVYEVLCAPIGPV